jgi:hypothetical protein
VRITRRHASNTSYRQPTYAAKVTGNRAYNGFTNVGNVPDMASQQSGSVMTRRPLGGCAGKDQLEWMEGVKLHRRSVQGPAPATDVEAKGQQDGEPAPPQNLGEEFTAVGRKFPRVSFEKVRSVKAVSLLFGSLKLPRMFHDRFTWPVVNALWHATDLGERTEWSSSAPPLSFRKPTQALHRVSSSRRMPGSL